jgi:hypothetical protein
LKCRFQQGAHTSRLAKALDERHYNQIK